MSKRLKKSKTNNNQFLRVPRGMHDILPTEELWWDRVNKVVRDVAGFYNFHFIETPILEFANLFARTTGEETDIVQKEMYTLRMKKGELLALRPEGTPSVARAYLQHHLGRISQPQKLFYIGPMFRHENPQAGRYRQFHQFGFEILGGTNDPIYDAQVIIILWRIIEYLKIKGVALKVNSVGCKVCRPLYKRQLQNYYKSLEKSLCSDCKRRLKTNPLRLLDCKNSGCIEFKKDAPNLLDRLCASCSAHLKGVLEYLDELGIAYSLDNYLVRGLDYYNKTVFEFFVEEMEGGAVGGGGRYDYLMEILGGRLMPAVGAAAGIERLVEVMKKQGVKFVSKAPKRVFLIHVGELAKKKSLKLIEELREAGILTLESLGKESLRHQLRAADKEGVDLVLIIGQKEIFEGNVILRDMKNRLQETVSLAKVVEEIKKKFKGN